jgi:hypothetical protein
MRSGICVAAGGFGLVALLSGCVVVPLPPPGDEWHTVSPEELGSWGDEPAGEAVIGVCPWTASELATPTPAEPSEDARAATEAIALPEEQFWELVESIPDRPTYVEFQLAAGALAGCGLSAVTGFQARLTLVLYDLDGAANHAWFVENDPDHLGYVSEDTFLYARCATVLAGRAIWERSVADETLEWSDDSLHESGNSELLLYVSGDAAGAHGLTLNEYFELLDGIQLSYETASNAERWPGL